MAKGLGLVRVLYSFNEWQNERKQTEIQRRKEQDYQGTKEP